METKKVNIADVQLGPIRHGVLPGELLERIKAFKHILGAVEPASLDQTIENFKRDAHPDREVAVWERIARTYHEFITRYAIADYKQRHDVYAALLGLSTGVDEFPKIRTLTTDQIAELKYNF